MKDALLGMRACREVFIGMDANTKVLDIVDYIYVGAAVPPPNYQRTGDTAWH